MPEFPRMLYQSGDAITVEGKGYNYLIVPDAEGQADAIKKGWRVGLDPLDHDGDGKKGGAVKPDISAALSLLEPNNDGHWTSAGLPSVEAVRDIVGENVTRKQIRTAFPDFVRPE